MTIIYKPMYGFNQEVFYLQNQDLLIKKSKVVGINTDSLGVYYRLEAGIDVYEVLLCDTWEGLRDIIFNKINSQNPSPEEEVPIGDDEEGTEHD